MGANLAKGKKNTSNAVVGHDPSVMRHYCQSVMSRTEIEKWKQFWMSLYPNGLATRDNFDSFIKLSAINYSTSGVDLMFRLMDANRDGVITFLEFLWFEALHGDHHNSSSGSSDVSMMGGDPDNECARDVRLGFIMDQAFLMYDVNGDGKLSKQEMSDTMRNCWKLGGCVMGEEKEREIEANVRAIFDVVGKDCDRESLTKEELLEAARSEPSLFSML